MNLRPPTPGMRDQELVQWFQRVYDAIKELDAAIKNLPDPDPPDPPDIPTSHNQLTENGGNNSHTVISQHMATDTAHQSDGPVVGRNELINSLAAIVEDLTAAMTGFKHGEEVDNPTENVHGAEGAVVGLVNVQTLQNKTIVRRVNTAVFDSDVREYDGYVRVTEDNITLELPDAEMNKGFEITIDNQSATNTILLPYSTDLIQDEATQYLPPACSVTLVSDGFTWRLV